MRDLTCVVVAASAVVGGDGGGACVCACADDDEPGAGVNSAGCGGCDCCARGAGEVFVWRVGGGARPQCV